MFLDAIRGAAAPGLKIVDCFATTRTTVGDVARLIDSFRQTRESPIMPSVGDGLARKLHATYLSYLDQDARFFAPTLSESDTGRFCELYKADAFGQVSVLTVAPGASRGNHFHHTKVENIHLAFGQVALSERDIRGGETMVRAITAGESVWTRPGWVHTLTNTGSGPAVLVIWANEVFDHDRPDTYAPDTVRGLGEPQ